MLVCGPHDTGTGRRRDECMKKANPDFRVSGTFVAHLAHASEFRQHWD
jgi:hypothetical protein